MDTMSMRLCSIRLFEHLRRDVRTASLRIACCYIAHNSDVKLPKHEFSFASKTDKHAPELSRIGSQTMIGMTTQKTSP